MLHFNKSLLIVSTFMLFCYSAKSQQKWRNWNSASVNIGLTKKSVFRITHLRSYSLNNNYTNTFNQTSGSLTYDLSRKISLLGGAMLTQVPANNKTSSRYYVRLSYKTSFFNSIVLSNSIQGEINSTNETRFHNRIIYIGRISNKKRFHFLNLNLSATYWLYYNIGGNTIKYYDNSGNIIARNTPDGFHRGRLYLTANSKLSKPLSISVYYMNQQEFNLFSPELRKINVVNPISGKVTRQFDNFNTIGFSLIYNINLFKNKN